MKGGEIMNLLAKSFAFDGMSLPEGYVLCSFESVDTKKETAIKLDTNKSKITPFRSQTSLYSVQYKDVITFSTSLMKCNHEKLTDDEYNSLTQWLLSPIVYRPFNVIDYPGITYHQNVVYNAICVGYDEFVINGDIYGLTFNFECDSSYGYSPEQSYDFTGNTPLVINNKTEELSEDIYPEIELHCNSTEGVAIKNNSYPEEMMTLKVLEGQTLTIDNKHGLIKDNLDMFNFGTDTNLMWIHLAPGINSITVFGDVTGTIKYRYVRKRGI